MNTNNRNQSRQRGAVSIFIVIFTALLLTVVTVSFIRIMLRDQSQSTSAELSQSALDSTYAGIEDAKRALVRYNERCGTNPGDTECVNMRNAMTTCGSIQHILHHAEDQDAIEAEVMVQSDGGGAGGDSALDQAYTCVKIALETPDYLGRTDSADKVNVIPLETAGQSFSRVQINWFTAEDAGDDTNPFDYTEYASPNHPLPSSSALGRPPIMEVQLVQHGQTFVLGDFDFSETAASPAGSSNTNTLFLYPNQNRASSPEIRFATDGARRASTGPTEVMCTTDKGSNYACTADIILPEPIGGLTADGLRAGGSLRVVPRYNKTTYQVILHNGDPANPVRFSGVQPEVDVTGRANDLFRRVKARIQTIDDAPYPAGAVDVSNNFCKVFTVARDHPDYQHNAATCDPNVAG